MMLTPLPRAAILATIVATGVSSAVVVQTADPHHPDTTTSQATSPPASDDLPAQSQGEQPAQPRMMGPADASTSER